MRKAIPYPLIAVITVSALLCIPGLWAQDSALAPSSKPANNAAVTLVLGHPFSAIKYAWQVKILPDGKVKFIQNERYPTRIARDTEGRVMMQMIHSDRLLPECDHLDLLVPPVCPVWGVFVIDPVAHTVTHWPEGVRAGRASVDFPLFETRLEETAHATAELPEVPPDFTDEDGRVTTADLGDQMIEGIQAHGIRSTLQYTKRGDSGQKINVTRIHEVWTAPEMKLIVRVIDGDPTGVETLWGLEKVSLAPDPSLFQPPADYEKEHRHSDEGTIYDFEYLETWFSK